MTIQKEFKTVADCVTLSNDEDGVADWIEKNIFFPIRRLQTNF